MSRNPQVESCIERVLEMRLKGPEHLSSMVFTFPGAKFNLEGFSEDDGYAGASPAVMGVLSGLTREYAERGKLPNHDLFVSLNGIADVEVVVSRADAKRLAQYQIIAIRRQKGQFGFHLPQNMFHLLDPGSPRNSNLLGDFQDMRSLRSRGRKRDVRRRLWLEQNKKCARCGDTIPTLDEVTLDHSLPRRMHGPNTLENFSATCDECNNEKADKLPFGLSAGDARLETYSLESGLWRPPARRFI